MGELFTSISLNMLIENDEFHRFLVNSFIKHFSYELLQRLGKVLFSLRILTDD